MRIVLTRAHTGVLLLWLQAIVSILLNSPNIDIGDELRNFRQFTGDMTPELRGLALGECELVRSVHNSFRRPDPFVVDGRRTATADDECFHFVAYMPINGRIYELDGLQEGPILHARLVDGEDWLERGA